MSKIRNKKFVWIFISLLIMSGLYLVLMLIDYQVKVVELQVTNISDTSASVFWITNKPSVGRVKVMNGGLRENVFYDDRDIESDANGFMKILTSGQKGRYTHHVTVYGLDQNKFYDFKLKNGLAEVDPDNSKFSTVATPDYLKDPNPIFGNVTNEEGIKVTDGIITLRLIDGAENISKKITVPIHSGAYTIDIANVYGDLTDKLFNIDNNTSVLYEVFGYTDGEIRFISTELDLATLKPAPNLILVDNFSMASNERLSLINKKIISYENPVLSDEIFLQVNAGVDSGIGLTPIKTATPKSLASDCTVRGQCSEGFLQCSSNNGNSCQYIGYTWCCKPVGAPTATKAPTVTPTKPSSPTPTKSVSPTSTKSVSPTSTLSSLVDCDDNGGTCRYPSECFPNGGKVVNGKCTSGGMLCCVINSGPYSTLSPTATVGVLATSTKIPNPCGSGYECRESVECLNSDVGYKNDSGKCDGIDYDGDDIKENGLCCKITNIPTVTITQEDKCVGVSHYSTCFGTPGCIWYFDKQVCLKSVGSGNNDVVEPAEINDKYVTVIGLDINVCGQEYPCVNKHPEIKCNVGLGKKCDPATNQECGAGLFCVGETCKPNLSSSRLCSAENLDENMDVRELHGGGEALVGLNIDPDAMGLDPADAIHMLWNSPSFDYLDSGCTEPSFSWNNDLGYCWVGSGASNIACGPFLKGYDNERKIKLLHHELRHIVQFCNEQKARKENDNKYECEIQGNSACSTLISEMGADAYLNGHEGCYGFFPKSEWNTGYGNENFYCAGEIFDMVAEKVGDKQVVQDYFNLSCSAYEKVNSVIDICSQFRLPDENWIRCNQFSRCTNSESLVPVLPEFMVNNPQTASYSAPVVPNSTRVPTTARSSSQDSGGATYDSTSSTISGKVDEGLYELVSDNTTVSLAVMDEEEQDDSLRFFEDKNADGRKQEDEFYVSISNLSLNKINDFRNQYFEAGWNLIAFPFLPKDNTGSTIATCQQFLSHLVGNGIEATNCSTYKNGKWYSTSKIESSVFGQDINLEYGRGYFIKIAKSGEIVLNGYKPIELEEQEMVSGWNLLSFNDLESGFSSKELIQQSNDVSIVSEWVNQTYNNYVYNAGVYYGNPFEIVDYKGYFVKKD